MNLMKTLGMTIALTAAVLTVSPATAADLKLGYVDAAKVLDQAPQATHASDVLKKEFFTREAELRSLQEKIKTIGDKLARDGMIMRESERQQLETDALSLKRELRRQQENFREDINIRRNEELGKLQVLIKASINAVGEEGDFDMILFEGIAYASPALDLTDKVLKKLKAAK